MNRARFSIYLVLVVALSASLAVARTPRPVTSAFFETKSAGFDQNYPDPAVAYSLNLAVSDNLARPAYLQVEYENPDSPNNPNDPDIQYLQVTAGQTTLSLKSRFFPRAQNRKSYRVVIEVFSDKNMKTKIGEHVQLVEFVTPRI
jgi:hypothetical protein